MAAIRTAEGNYDAANNLTDYTYEYTSEDYAGAWTYAFSNFVGAGQPARETITASTGESYGYDLLYDSYDRLIAAVPDDGEATTWTYDDIARTITMDYGNGQYVGVTTYDAQNHQLSEAYTGSHPDVVDSDETWVWDGDNLDTVTSRSGSEAAPHTLEVISTATMRYACASARRVGSPSRIARMRPMMR
jgi:YD repeat-containing protein